MDYIVFSVMCLFSHAVTTNDRQGDHEHCLLVHENWLKFLSDEHDRVEAEMATQVQTIDTVLAELGAGIDRLKALRGHANVTHNRVEDLKMRVTQLERMMTIVVVFIVAERLCMYFL